MARYIDADEAMQIINNYAKAIDYDCDNCKVVIDAIKDIVSVICPTADVVEVVRCCECKCCEQCYPAKAIDEEPVEGWYCNLNSKYVLPTHFCSYGERRDT